VVQLKALRPDLEFVPIRGNIQTRLSKLDELDGVVLAAAGLKRMGLADQVTEYFDTDKVLPASGQGILAIETLADCHSGGSLATDRIQTILSRVNDAPTYCIAVAEMAFLKALNAGCQFPVASFAEFVADASNLKIRGIYWDESSQRLLRAEHGVQFGALESGVGESFENAVTQARDAGIALAGKIREQLAR
jgi:hydroxymethylbilane synthase